MTMNTQFSLGTLQVPAIEIRGRTAGPRLAVVAGIHGREYPSIAAARRLVEVVDPERLCGTVIAVPIVNLTAFWAQSRFAPEDRKDLNRCFPGVATGTYSDVLAHDVFEQIIAPSDCVIDLHGGDMIEELVPYTFYDQSEVEDRAREIARAFGFGFAIRIRRTEAPLQGSTSLAAASAGIPAITTEAGGRGLLESPYVEMHVQGVLGVLRHLEMLDTHSEAATLASPRHVDRFVFVYSPMAGWWSQPGPRARGCRKATPSGRFPHWTMIGLKLCARRRREWCCSRSSIPRCPQTHAC